MLKENIIEILLASHKITKEQLDKALSLQAKRQAPLRKVLLEEKIISEQELLSLLATRLFIPSLHLAKYKFDPQITKLIPERVARLYKVMPLSRMGNTLTVAVTDPLNIFALDDLKTLTQCNIDLVLSPEEEILKALDEEYRRLGENNANLKEPQETPLSQEEAGLLKQEEIELTSALKESQKPPIVKLVELLLMQALKKRASDIHLEPEEDVLRIRYRIDGALHDILRLPKVNQNAICARIKIISNLDITENRIPQDGRFKVRFEGKEIDFRVSALPTTFGQKFVLRLLDKANLYIGLDQLGFSPKPLAIFKEAVLKPFGILLVTGPTGSGKTTTLYAGLSQLNTIERNIITIEDPVEYQIEGLTQLQVKPEIGLDFASGLRSLLRQSPDVIMIGEIRDRETADIAIKASLTGQLALSTLHTNDAISGISRLTDMGVEPFLISSSLIMLSAQRLCRRLCVKCRVKQDVEKDFLQEIGFGPSEKSSLYQAKGCQYCNYTGFYGRIAITEAVMIDDTIREMIIKQSAIEEIKKYAIEAQGMQDLRQDAFVKVREGLTTLEEALRITAEE